MSFVHFERTKKSKSVLYCDEPTTKIGERKYLYKKSWRKEREKKNNKNNNNNNDDSKWEQYYENVKHDVSFYSKVHYFGV